MLAEATDGAFVSSNLQLAGQILHMPHDLAITNTDKFSAHKAYSTSCVIDEFTLFWSSIDRNHRQFLPYQTQHVEFHWMELLHMADPLSCHMQYHGSDGLGDVPDAFPSCSSLTLEAQAGQSQVS